MQPEREYPPEETQYYGDRQLQEASDDDYEGEEEDSPESCAVAEGDIYSTPGVCQTTLQEIILARGPSLIARTIYKVPDMSTPKK